MSSIYILYNYKPSASHPEPSLPAAGLFEAKQPTRATTEEYDGGHCASLQEERRGEGSMRLQPLAATIGIPGPNHWFYLVDEMDYFGLSVKKARKAMVGRNSGSHSSARESIERDEMDLGEGHARHAHEATAQKRDFIDGKIRRLRHEANKLTYTAGEHGYIEMD